MHNSLYFAADKSADGSKGMVINMKRIITEEALKGFRNQLLEEERSENTIRKYLRDIRKLKDYAQEKEVTKSLVIEFKEKLLHQGQYEISSINTFIIAVNRFLEYMGWYEAKVKTYKLQKASFVPDEKYLTKKEYERLVMAARQSGNIRLALILNTICATGIRISELQYFTVDSVKRGKVIIHNKGKVRNILIPSELQKKLKCYAIRKQIKKGVIFCTSSGKPMERSNIWREMKALCRQANVREEKVFPHNLRHLFAQCFYALKKDLAKLADVLGHSNIETTRIYVRTSCEEQRKQLELMHMVC